MPSKNVIKSYVNDGFYHVYNRGVEKRRIFEDDQDYRVFLHLLKYYLSPSSNTREHPLKQIAGFSPVRRRPLESLNKRVEVHTFCLMPNHFHLLVRQKADGGMEKLMRKISTNYAMYFNRRYDRVGHLFQGPYKAVLISQDDHLLHVSRYIHANPTLTMRHLNNYPYSSYGHFLNEKKADWLTTDFLLSFFRKGSRATNGFYNYKEFVETNQEDSGEILGRLVIADD